MALRRTEINEYWWNYTTANFSNRLHTSIKYRAKKKGLPFNLEVSDLSIPEKCPMTGITLQIRTEKGKKNYFTPSVDRIVPELGYVKGNIRIVCLWYNTAKLMFTDEEVLDLCKKVIETHGALSTT